MADTNDTIEDKIKRLDKRITRLEKLVLPPTGPNTPTSPDGGPNSGKSIYERIETIEQQLDNHKNRLNDIEEKPSTYSRLDDLQEQITSLQSSLKDLGQGQQALSDIQLGNLDKKGNA